MQHIILFTRYKAEALLFILIAWSQNLTYLSERKLYLSSTHPKI